MKTASASKSRFWNKKLILGTSLSSAVILFLAGIIFWGGFNTAMEETNKLEFCINCHEMQDNVYQEYKPTIHYANRTGVRAGCPDCHVPKPWIHKVVRKIKASKEVFSWLTGKIDTKEKFEEHRLTMAKSVWNEMKETDSRECRNCHNLESMNPEFQKPRARKQHLSAFEAGQTCIDCHKGIAHKNVRHMLADDELEELEKPNPEYIREIPEMYKAGLLRVEQQEKEQAVAKLAAKQKARAAEQQRIDAAVEKALTEQALKSKKGAKPATTAKSEIDVDWSKSSSREITVFYPGTASIEWIHGRNHGGKRAFTKGERCVDCHDEEVADMGAAIVSGESEKELEPNVIPGKRGSIPVVVNASYDEEYLYMRFTWDEGEHAPVPFVDGGKMDPENAVKIAVMFATDEVEYADRAGCWGTCHVDAEGMPGQPETSVFTGSELASRAAIKGAVTKYIKESRTKVEMKGRRGKKLGGWDKLKDESDVAALAKEGTYMDIIRYSSGSKLVEDGSILEDRNMHGGQGAVVESSLAGGVRTVIFKRKLKSSSEGDVSLDKSQTYNLGFAIHDDYAKSRYHHVSLGYKLGFDNADAEVNAVKL